MRRIFVSHSSKTPPDVAYLQALEARLRARGFEVFVDRSNLVGGDDWINKISNQLVYCQGAVFLVTEAALDSNFVHVEVGDLLFRWRRAGLGADSTPVFPLVPLLCADLGKRLAEHPFWKAIRFADVQHIGPLPVEDAVEDLVRRFAHLPNQVGIASPLANLEAQIQTILASATPLLLRTAGLAAGFGDAGALGDSGLPAHFAQCLLLGTVPAAYKFLMALGAGISEEMRRNLFELLAPSWVSRTAATRLQDVAVSVINGKNLDFTPGMYLRRWRNQRLREAGIVVTVEGVNTATFAEQQLKAKISDALAKRLGVLAGAADPISALRRKIDARIGPLAQAIVVAIPCAEADLPVNARLASDPLFAGIKFVLMCSEASVETKETLLSGNFPDVEWLTPDLGVGQEDRFSQQHEIYSEGLFENGQ